VARKADRLRAGAEAVEPFLASLILGRAVKPFSRHTLRKRFQTAPFPASSRSRCCTTSHRRHYRTGCWSRLGGYCGPAASSSASTASARFFFRLIHLGDTYTPVDPDTFRARLEAAGFAEVAVELAWARFRFRAARKYGAGTGTGGQNHALLWNGTANSAVDLNPATFNVSNSIGTDGGNQVWFAAGAGTANQAHAVLWSGTANSAIDLNPTNLTGIKWSEAYAVGGDEQVGYGRGSLTGGQDHAMLWNGTANSAADLNPAAYTTSHGSGTNGMFQVDFGFTIDGSHALLWNGSADSVVDLQTVLPGGLTQSEADSIDFQGRIFGTAVGSDGMHAVEWLPVPEPCGLRLALAGVTVCLCFPRPIRKILGGGRSSSQIASRSPSANQVRKSSRVVWHT
jgi:hypothetical protein